MTDTPIQPQTDTPVLPQSPPPPLMDRVKGFIGDLGRPYNQYVIGTATAVAIVIGATKITTAEGGAIYITAVGVITLGIFGLKSIENIKAGGQARDVAIAQSQTAASTT